MLQSVQKQICIHMLAFWLNGIRWKFKRKSETTSSQTLSPERNVFCDRRKTGGWSVRKTDQKERLSPSGRRRTLLSFVIACHSSLLDTAKLRRCTPMKYSPKLSLLKKRGEQPGSNKCAVIKRQMESPLNALDVRFAQACLQRGWGQDRETSRGSIKCSHKCTPNSTPVSRAKATNLQKHCVNSAAL